MKNRTTIIVLTIILFASGSSLAQFNTLMPTKPDKAEDFKIMETPKEENSNQKKGEKIVERNLQHHPKIGTEKRNRKFNEDVSESNRLSKDDA